MYWSFMLSLRTSEEFLRGFFYTVTVLQYIFLYKINGINNSFHLQLVYLIRALIGLKLIEPNVFNNLQNNET